MKAFAAPLVASCDEWMASQLSQDSRGKKMLVLASCHPLKGEADLIYIVRNPMVECDQHWRQVVDHPIYQRELRRLCERLVQKYRLPSDWQEDVEQEAVLLLHRAIARSRTLGFNPVKMNGGPFAWLRMIIRSHCLQAIRTLRRRQRRFQTFGGDGSHFAASSEPPWRSEFWLALEALPVESRRAIEAYLEGGSVQAAADKLGLAWSTARRVIQKHLQAFRRELEARHCEYSARECGAPAYSGSRIDSQ